jgi:ABC-2 type transport system permease protein
MRNTWLIFRREYVERVRTRSFIVLTLLVPAIMTGLMVLPAKMATMGDKVRHIVIVTSTQQFGETVRQELLSAPSSDDEDTDKTNTNDQVKQKTAKQYIIDVDSTPTEAEKTTLREEVTAKKIDAYLWLTDDAVAAKKVTWYSRDLASFGETSWLGQNLDRILARQELLKNGIGGTQADELLKPVTVEPIRIEHGKESKSKSDVKFIEIVVMVMLLYVAVLLYGISVMRSVLEEKNSRVLEVLLSSATSTELMTGKILGVGAVGLTQILIWVIMAGAVAIPTLAMQPSLSDLQISPQVFGAFAVFFFLGYLLYSTMYAAVGAITTTEQEGQQLQFIVVIPLVLSVFMLGTTLRTPDAPAVVWTSLIPFFAPIVMYTRIVVQTPPLWQIALSLFLLIATVGGLMVLCARIYRVGVLIYGKRATLPEILKWLKYAKA